MLVHRAAPQQAAIGEPHVAVVEPKLVQHGVVGDEHVGVAVAVEVRAHRAQAVAERDVHAGRVGRIRERAVAVVAVQAIHRRRLIDVRPAIGGMQRGGGAILFDGRRPVDVVDDEQIQVAIQIQVQKRGGGAPARVANPRLRGHVLKTAAPVVAQQRVGAEIRHIEIRIAIVVVIAGGHAHAVAAIGGVAEVARLVEMAVVPVQVQPVRRIRPRCADAPALHQVQVQIVVPIHVHQRDAAGHDLRQQVPLHMARNMREIHPAQRRFFVEPGRGRRRTRAGEQRQSSKPTAQTVETHGGGATNWHHASARSPAGPSHSGPAHPRADAPARRR